MKIIIIIISIALCVLYACFFSKGVKILGMPAEIFFNKKKSDENDAD